MSRDNPLLTFTPADTPGEARLRVQADRPRAEPIGPYLTGKFCEHLGANIYNGMCAQILRNPTFADFPFGSPGNHPDGGHKPECDEARIAAGIRARAARFGWPEEDAERLVESRADGLAHWWIRLGSREAVRVSPDAGLHGGRAQRIEASAAGEGIAQWVYLPLHRVRKFTWRVVARSNALSALTVGLTAQGTTEPAAGAELTGLNRRWGAFTGEWTVPESVPADALVRFSLTAAEPGQFVIERALLEPADAIDGADPDVIRRLKESHLPLLRWPGGNFVSGYHWEDGVGPVDQRPTRPNLAWGSVEPNLFGTDEFVAFCRAVGCEPMICINAGSGTPAEAARWVEYCNGPPDSPQGARRAENGRPEPYGIHSWEIGNELTGRHQRGWTTPAGYADRYREFAEAMLEADPSIALPACGAPPWWEADWNERLFRENTDLLTSTTDHILVGGRVAPSADPLDVHRDSMAVPIEYERHYTDLREQMLAADIAEPRLGITELQLFAGIGPEEPGGEPPRLTRRNLVSPATQAESLYDTLIYHLAVRLGSFVEMITHSATVNHGGGLRKERERVYPNPCHHAQSMFAAFAGARPLPVELTCSQDPAPGILSCTPKGLPVPVLDALAALAPDGTLLISIVHRGIDKSVSLDVELPGADRDGECDVILLAADHPWDANTLDNPKHVRPVRSAVPIGSGRLVLTVPPYALMHIRVPAGDVSP